MWPVNDCKLSYQQEKENPEIIEIQLVKGKQQNKEIN